MPRFQALEMALQCRWRNPIFGAAPQMVRWLRQNARRDGAAGAACYIIPTCGACDMLPDVR